MLKWRVVTRSGLDRGLRRVVDCGAAIAAMGRIERNVTTLHDDNLRLIGFLTAVGAHNTIRGPRLAANITSLLVGLGELPGLPDLAVPLRTRRQVDLERRRRGHPAGLRVPAGRVGVAGDDRQVVPGRGVGSRRSRHGRR